MHLERRQRGKKGEGLTVSCKMEPEIAAQILIIKEIEI